ncbi:MAG TPA: hypothetical protein VGR73_18875 [Bryobacteraceae bacterium]|nr:hypothetical protein [Bryobacteraceae bacterium]
MKYMLRMVLLGNAGALAYIWLTSEILGGEKRYEQGVRQVKDRHSNPISVED